jgi:hypothetical protein
MGLDTKTYWLNDWPSVAMWLLTFEERAYRKSVSWELQNLVAEARDSSGTQMKENVRCWKGYQGAQWRPWLRTPVCVWQWFVKASQELFKGSINPIANPNPVHHHSIVLQYISHYILELLNNFRVILCRLGRQVCIGESFRLNKSGNLWSIRLNLIKPVNNFSVSVLRALLRQSNYWSRNNFWSLYTELFARNIRFNLQNEIPVIQIG